MAKGMIWLDWICFLYLSKSQRLGQKLRGCSIILEQWKLWTLFVNRENYIWYYPNTISVHIFLFCEIDKNILKYGLPIFMLTEKDLYKKLLLLIKKSVHITKVLEIDLTIPKCCLNLFYVLISQLLLFFLLFHGIKIMYEKIQTTLKI